MKLGMIDYGRGNLRSVINACRTLGHDPQLISKPEELANITHLIFPGQGAFGDCMESLHRLNLANALMEWINNNKPNFGICVGYQLLFETSAESPGTKGLGIIAGNVEKFTSSDIKIPHMGWNSVTKTNSESQIWQDFPEEPYFYFVHSYYPVGVPENVVAAKCHYGQETFCAAIQKGRLFATQFHPEKSQHAGLKLLGNFLKED